MSGRLKIRLKYGPARGGAKKSLCPIVVTVPECAAPSPCDQVHVVGVLLSLLLPVLSADRPETQHGFLSSQHGRPRRLPIVTGSHNPLLTYLSKTPRLVVQISSLAKSNMSNASYCKWWIVTKQQLLELREYEEIKRKKMKEPIQDRNKAVRILGDLYARYSMIVQELDLCLDQMCQVLNPLLFHKQKFSFVKIGPTTVHGEEDNGRGRHSTEGTER